MKDPLLYDPSILDLAGIPVTLPGPRPTLAADPFAYYKIAARRPLGDTPMSARQRRFVAKVEGWVALYRRGVPPAEIMAAAGVPRDQFNAALRRYAKTDYAAAWALRLSGDFRVRTDIPWTYLIPKQVQRFRRAEDAIRRLESKSLDFVAAEMGSTAADLLTLLRKYMLFRPPPPPADRVFPKPPTKRQGRPHRAELLKIEDLQAYRERRVTQAQLADLYGVLPATMNSWLLIRGGKTPNTEIREAMGGPNGKF